MKRGFALAVVLICSVVHVASGAASGTTTLWYNGDGDPRWFGGGTHNNIEWTLFDKTEMVFEDFVVSDPSGWDVTTLWSNNVTNSRTPITQARWAIRTGMTAGLTSAGGGGTLVAAGITSATQSTHQVVNDPFPMIESTIEVSDLFVHLPPGTYWVGVAPVIVDNDQSLPSDTLGLGANAVGVAGGADNAYVWHRNWSFAGEDAFVLSDRGASPPNYSLGVGGSVGPNGKIAFITNAPPPPPPGVNEGYYIHTINPDGSSEATLPSVCNEYNYCENAIVSPVWSPDGSKISWSNGSFVRIMNADGTGLTSVTNSTDPAYSPPLPALRLPSGEKLVAFVASWSPDGCRLAIIGNFTGGASIFTLKPDGTDIAAVPNTEILGYNTWLDWSPDGSKIAFTRTDPNLHQIGNDFGYDSYVAVVALADGTVTDLTSHAGVPSNFFMADTHPDWSPDGSKIVFARQLQDGFEQDTDVPTEIYVVNANGTGLAQLTHASASGTHNANPAWSPDGTKIVYDHFDDIDGHTQVHVANADGSDEYALTSGPYEQGMPNWQPLPGGGPITCGSSASSTTSTSTSTTPSTSTSSSTEPTASTSTSTSSTSTSTSTTSSSSSTSSTSTTPSTSASSTSTSTSTTSSSSSTSSTSTTVSTSASSTTSTSTSTTSSSSSTLSTSTTVSTSTSSSTSTTSTLALADSDGDGIANAIDTGDGTFQDGGTTAGTIGVIPVGYAVTVTDLPDPAGVHVIVSGTGTEKVTIVLTNPASGTPCGTVNLLPGADMEFTCGSITTRALAGRAEIVLSDDSSLYVDAPEKTTVSIATDGSFVVVGPVEGGDGKLTLVSSGVSTVIDESSPRIEMWDFVGFSQPVDNNSVFNVAKGGSTIPLKWRLLTEAGTAVTNLASASVAVAAANCGSGSTFDDIEQMTASASGLQNLGNGYYQLNWKTPKTTGCKAMRLSLAGEGPITHTALFGFN